MSTAVKADVWAVCWSGAFRCVLTQCQGGKTSANEPREAIVAPHQSKKGYEDISKEFRLHHSTVRKIIHKWKTFNAVANLPWSGRSSKFATRSDCVMLRETAKNSRATLQT